MQEIAQIVDLINKAGVIGLLVLFTVGGMKKWWVWGWLYEQEVRNGNEWKHLALKGTDIADKATEVAKSATKTND